MEYLTKANDKNDSFSMPVYCSKKIEIPSNNSDYFSILFFSTGVVTLLKENVTLSSPGILCIAPGYDVSEIKISSINENDNNENNFFSLIFKPSGINSTFKNFPDTFEYSALTKIEKYNYIILNSTVTDKMRLLFSQVYDELNRTQSSFWPCLTRSYVLEIILLIGRMQYATMPSSILSIPQADKKTQEIFQYIHNNYSKEITLDSLASRFSTNRTTLNKIFNQTCGTSVISYLSRIRLEMATLLLRNTELPISDIAIRSGFIDESYFSRLFKQKVGKSPSEYRKTIPNPYGM